MIGVLGHNSALLRQYWAGDNLGRWDEFCYESCPWCRSLSKRQASKLLSSQNIRVIQFSSNSTPIAVYTTLVSTTIISWAFSQHTPTGRVLLLPKHQNYRPDYIAGFEGIQMLHGVWIKLSEEVIKGSKVNRIWMFRLEDDCSHNLVDSSYKKLAMMIKSIRTLQ